MNEFADTKTVSDLGRDGSIKPEFILAWLKAFRRTVGAEQMEDFPLTALQRLVACDPIARDVRGPNLVVAGSTSAGKTMAAEILMARQLTEANVPYGCIYAVPLRALATEKYTRFKSIFGNEDVYISSGDYQDQDAFILHMRFRIAVVVYEKLYGWFLQSNARNAILKNLGMLVVDELHMLGDTQRGPRLEMLLTFVRQIQTETSSGRLRIVGLGPHRGALSPIAKWLGAKLIAMQEDVRPVPLVEGYVCPEGHRLEPVDERLAATKIAIPQIHGTRRDAMLRELVKGLLARDGTQVAVGVGKRLLVYCPTKDGAERAAEALAAALGHRQAPDEVTRAESDALERTQAMSLLRRTMVAGVGFHHGDLTFGERSLVERLFRAEPPAACLDVVLCTPTLAMGVNLPADYMIFTSNESYKPKDWDQRSNESTPLTPLEYRNFAGRAGRYRPNAPPDHHGVALFISERTHEETLRETVEPIIRGRVTPVASEMHRWPYGIEPLALAAADFVAGTTRRAPSTGMRSVFEATYGGHSKMKLSDAKQTVLLVDAVGPKLFALAEKHEELVSKDFSVLKTGNVVARAGIHILTYEALREIAIKVKEGVLDRPLVILEALAGVPEIVKLYPTAISDAPREQAKITRALRSFFIELTAAGQPLGPLAENLTKKQHVPDRNTLECLMRVAAVWLWIEGKSAEYICSQAMLPGIRYGACSLLGDQLHWLVSTLPDLWDALGLSSDVDDVDAADFRWAMGRLERRLRFGIPDHLVSIAQLRVPGLHRENMVDLWKSVAGFRRKDRGWDHPVELLSLTPKRLGPWRERIHALQRAVMEHAWTDDPREASQKQTDTARMACDGPGARLVDMDWPAVLLTIWTLDNDDQLANELARALTLRPLGLVVNSVKVDNLSRYFLQHDGRTILLTVLGSGKTVEWSAVRAQWGAQGPSGKRVDGVLVLATGAIDGLAEHVLQYGEPIRVVTREALGYMIVQALVAPQEDTADAGAAQSFLSVPKAVRDWLLSGGASVLATSADAERVLKTPGLDDGWRESRWVQGRTGQTAYREPTAEDIRARSLRERQTSLLREEIHLLEGDEPFIKSWIAQFVDEVDRLEKDPTTVAEHVRRLLESLIKQVLIDHGDFPDKIETKKLLDRVSTLSVMSPSWVQWANNVRMSSNPAHHVEITPNKPGCLATRTYSFGEACELMRTTVRLCAEYLERRPVVPVDIVK